MAQQLASFSDMPSDKMAEIRHFCPGGEDPIPREVTSELRPVHSGTGLVAMASVLLLLFVLAILFPAFALLRPVLELLDAALLVRRQVPFALLFAQGFEFPLREAAILPFCARAEIPDRVNP